MFGYRKSLLVPVVLLLLAVPLSTLAGVIYSEDFEDGVADGFTPGDEFWSVSDGVYQCNVTGNEYLSATQVGDCLWTDYRFDCDVKVVGGVNQIVQFRVRDSGNYYEVHVLGDPYNVAQLYKFTAGYRHLLESRSFANSVEIWHHLQVRAVGGEFSASFDERDLFTYLDRQNPVLCGGVGLVGYAGGQTQSQLATFDNVVVAEYSPLAISLDPIADPVVVPSEGGAFLYDALLENKTSEAVIVKVRIEADMPGGATYLIREVGGIYCPSQGTVAVTGIAQAVPAYAPSGDYVYRLSALTAAFGFEAQDAFGFTKEGADKRMSGAEGWTLSGFGSSSGEIPVQDGTFALGAASPNPFNPETTIAFDLSRPGPVTMQVFDVAGRLVRTLLDTEYRQAGRNDVLWDGRSNLGATAPSGVYFYTLEAEGSKQVRRMVMVK